MNTALRLGLVASLLLHPHFAESKKCLQNLPVHLKLVVCDQSGLNAESLLTAKTHTLHIFERAGVDVTWIELTDRTTGCTFADHGKYFTVVIAPTAPKGWASVDAMGLAPLLYGQYPRAYIFHSLAKIYAKTLEFSDEKKAICIIIGKRKWAKDGDNSTVRSRKPQQIKR